MTYPRDLNDKQWNLIKPLLPPEKEMGRPRIYERRSLVNGILYIMKTGCFWEYLPSDFPAWKSVYHYFMILSNNDIWEEINAHLRKTVRKSVGRDENPSLVAIDSQSVKGDVNLEAKGIDGNKKVNGRKRHIAVDVLGLVIACMITSANTSDISAGRDIANKLCDNHNNPRMQKIVADSAYKSLQASTGGIKVDISEKDPNVKGFIPVRHRWIVERTFA